MHVMVNIGYAHLILKSMDFKLTSQKQGDSFFLGKKRKHASALSNSKKYSTISKPALIRVVSLRCNTRGITRSISQDCQRIFCRSRDFWESNEVSPSDTHIVMFECALT